MKSLTKLWCEEVWKRKYGMTARWSGKDAKLLQGLIVWVGENFEESVLDVVAKGMEDYVKDSDKFYDRDKHPFSKFASNPAKWLHKMVAGKNESSTMEKEKKEKKGRPFKRLSDGEIRARIEANREAYAKGFRHSYPAMLSSQFLKKKDETFPRRFIAQLRKVLGEERVQKLFLSAGPIVKPL
jgi:hypothetical protein